MLEPAAHCPCSTHADAPAAWRCEGCAADLCEACAASLTAGRGTVVACTRCGGPVLTLTVPRESLGPFRTQAGSVLRAACTPMALAQLVLMTTTLTLLCATGPRSWAFGRLLELGWIGVALHRAAHGWKPFTAHTNAELAGAWLGTLPRLALAAAPLLVGSSLMVNLGSEAASPRSVATWGLAALAVAVLPSALVSAAVDGSGTRWRWPWQLMDFEKRLDGELAVVRQVAAGFVALQLLSAFAPPLTLDADMKLFEHIVLTWFAHGGSVAALMVLVTLAGGLVHHCAASLEHGDPQQAQVPVLPDAQPSGHWTPPEPTVDLEAQAKRYAPIALEDPREQLESAIQRRDGATVHALLVADGADPAQLSFESLIAAAQAVATHGEPELASRLLEGGLLRQPRHGLAPRAMIILARLLGERLQRLDAAQAIYRQVLERFPETDAARFAASRLSGG